MSPVVAEILEQIDRLPLVEQTNILRQLEQKIETATAHSAALPNLANTSQQQWQQAVDRIHDRTPISVDLQRARITDMLAKFKGYANNLPRVRVDRLKLLYGCNLNHLNIYGNRV
jgi:hypothetical protein